MPLNLNVNLKILLTGLSSPVNYGEKSVVNNIGPWSNTRTSSDAVAGKSKLTWNYFHLVPQLLGLP
jgi:hypothetical protein